MAKHNMFRSELPPKPSRLPVHPIWRGIGCLLIVFLPFASYYIATILIESKDKFPWVIIPEDVILKNYPRDPLIAVRFIYALIIFIAVIAVLSLLTSIVMRLFSPSKYDPVDIPPEKIYKP